MTDRLQALTVTLDADQRDDDSTALIAAIRQLRGVLDVTPHVTHLDAHVARQRARADLLARLFRALEDTND